MKLTVALATNDGQNFINKHFGEANKYQIYEFNNDNYKYIKSIQNNSITEEKHADPKKAKSIVKILKEKNVHCGVSCAFGPNIKRVKKHIVPVIMKEEDMETGIQKLIDNFTSLEKCWNDGKNREHINIK